jgi:hypothetical protein
MSEPNCDLVAERLALGEPLGELDAHTASCERCTRLCALPVRLANTGHAADPGIGFSSRVTAGAQHRITVRRRNRIVGTSLMSMAAAAMLVLVATHHAEDPGVAFQMPSLVKYKPAVMQPQHEQREVDPDVRALVDIADVDRDLHVHTHWGRIEKPLRAYKAVLEGNQP